MQTPRKLVKSGTVDADNVDPAVDVHEAELDNDQASQTLREAIILDSDEEDLEFQSDINDLAEKILKSHSSVRDSATELNGRDATNIYDLSHARAITPDSGATTQVLDIDGTSRTSTQTDSTVDDGQH